MTETPTHFRRARAALSSAPAPAAEKQTALIERLKAAPPRVLFEDDDSREKTIDEYRLTVTAAKLSDFLAGGDWDVVAHVKILRESSGALSLYTADLIERLFTALNSQPAMGLRGI